MANVGTYDNILPTGLSNLVVQNVTGFPTSYNVYNGNGVLVASGSWPSLTTAAKEEDQTVAHAMGSTSSATAATITPAALNTGDVLVVCLASGQNIVTNYATNPYITGGGTSAHPVTWSSPSIDYATIWVGVYTGPNVTTGITPISLYAPSSTSYSEDNYWTFSRWSGCTTEGTLDQYGNSATGGGGTKFGQDITPGGNGEVVIEVVTGQTSGYVFTSGSSSFTDFPSATGDYASSGGLAVGYQIQTTATALTAITNGWVATASGFAQARAAAVTLSPATGGTTLSIPAPSGTWAPGWYYVDLITGTYGTYGYSVDSVQVSIFRDLGKLPSPASLPAVGSNPQDGVLTTQNDDFYLHGLIVHGPLRYVISDTASPTTQAGGVSGTGLTIAGIEAGISAETTTTGYFETSDPARPRYPLVSFTTDYTTTVGGAVAPATYEAGVTSVVSAIGPGTASAVTYFEGLNEPDEAPNLSDAQTATLYNQFRGAVIAGSASAKALGPAYVSAGPAGNSITGADVSNVSTFITDVRSGSGAVDAVSVHNYNGWTPDPLVPEGWLSALRTMLATFTSPSLANVPVWCTEFGNVIKNFYNGGSAGGSAAIITDRRLVAGTATSYITAERYGIPKEQISYFYDGVDGEQSVYTWLKSTDGSLGPQAVFFRVYSEELWGKSWLRTLSFGATGNLLYRGHVFSEGSSGSGTGACAILWAPGMVSDTVTVTGLGTAAVTVSDWLGNTTTHTPSAGSISLTISDLPTYVRIPLANAATVAVQANIGSSTNLALTATASAGSNPASLTTTSLLNNGILETGGYLGGTDATYQATTLPQYIELTWGTAQTVNHVVIRQAPPYTDWGPASPMLTGVLQYWNGSAWVNCATNGTNHWDTAGNYNNTSATDILTTIGHDQISGTDSLIYSQWDQNWVLNVPISQVSTTKLRLTISTVSAGNFLTANPNPPTPTVTVAEMMAFSVSTIPRAGYSVTPYASTPYAGGSQSSVNVTPPTATGSGVGINPTVSVTSSVNVTPLAAPGAGVGVNPTVAVKVLPSAAPGVGVGVNPSVSTSTNISVSPSAATGTGAGVGPTITVGISPAASAGSGAGVAETTTINPHPSAAPATGVGVGPTVTTAGTPSAASGSGVGVTPTVTVNVTAAAASGTGVGVNPSVTTGTLVYPAAATGTGAGAAPSPTVAVGPPAAPGTGVGVNPSVSTSGTTNVYPAAATGTGAGVTPSLTVGVTTSAGTGTGVGVHPTLSVGTSPTASTGSGAGVAPTVTVAIGPSGAAGTGVGVDPSLTNNVNTNPAAATGSGVGVNPTITASGVTNVYIVPASGTGIGATPVVQVPLNLPGVSNPGEVTGTSSPSELTGTVSPSPSS